MPLPNSDIDTKCNKILDDLVSTLGPIQIAYSSGKSGYWQGIKTHITPKDGAKGIPDKTKKPTDQIEDWDDVGVSLPVSMELSPSVNVYDGPNGKGYEILGEIELSGKLWRKTINVGPEIYRNSDWQ